jgi:hypothetical protein
MLTITAKQAEALHQDLRRRFIDRMVAHIRQYFPRQFDVLGEPEVRVWIEAGIQRSGEYGIVSERDVCKYIDIMMVFGREFDKDPACSWAPPILTAEPVDPTLKTERLFQTARQQASAGGGRFRA